MEIELPAQHCSIHYSSFQLFLLNFCIIPSRVKQFSALSSEKRRENNICGRTFPARLACAARDGGQVASIELPVKKIIQTSTILLAIVILGYS